MFKKILVCLDGSNLAEQILPFIMAQGNCFDKIVFLKVLASPEISLPFGVPGAPSVPINTEARLARFQKELIEAPAYLEKIAQPLREIGLDVDCVVLQGMPSETIVNYAKDNRVELIAMATHGHSGLRQVIVGSTAEFVLKNAGWTLLLMTPQKQGKAAR